MSGANIPEPVVEKILEYVSHLWLIDHKKSSRRWLKDVIWIEERWGDLGVGMEGSDGRCLFINGVYRYPKYKLRRVRQRK